MQTNALINPRDLKAFLAAVSESENRFDEATSIARALVASGKVTKERILKSIDNTKMGSVLKNGAKNLLFAAFDAIMASKPSVAQEVAEVPIEIPADEPTTQEEPGGIRGLIRRRPGTLIVGTVAAAGVASQYVLDNAQARALEKKQQPAPVTSAAEPSTPLDGAEGNIKSAVDRLKEEDAKRKTTDRSELTDIPRSR